MTSEKTYHEGELIVQQRASKAQAARRTSSIIGNHIPNAGIHFVAQQPMVVVGSVDNKGYVWASLLFGEPGFLSAPDERTLILKRIDIHSTAEDPLWGSLHANSDVGLLVIELESRQRLRVNGHVRQFSGDRICIDVERVYPNCTKYIQRRHLACREQQNAIPSKPGFCDEKLSAAQQTMIREADTFFVASAHPKQGVDASHRGGKPGFIQVLDAHTLRIPDFPGNNMFNTLGNFASYPRAGLVFFDFDHGHVLQLSGRVSILWDRDDFLGETGGTCRYWEFNIDTCYEHTPIFQVKWTFVDYSPFLPGPDGR